MTKDKRYPAPDRGSFLAGNPETPIQESFRRLEDDVVIFRPEAELSEWPAPAGGPPFLASDSGKLFKPTGGSWGEVSIGSERTDEEIQDVIDAVLSGGDNISVNYDDAGNAISISLGSHASTHQKDGSDELSTFGETTHDSVDTGQLTLSGTTRSSWPSGGGAAITGQIGAGDVFFEAEFHSTHFGSGHYDPDIFHRKHFSDGQYRVVVEEPSTNSIKLYKTADFSSFTQVSSDILPNEPAGGGYSTQDHVVRNGEFIVYRSFDDGTTPNGTEVWTGSSLTTLSRVGKVVDWPDCGVFYDAETDTIHIYPEGAQISGEPCSNYLKHFTTPGDDLTNATEHANAIDVSGESWHTGDPDIIQFGGDFWMVMDNAETHPTYTIALAQSNDLYNWTIVSDSITGVYGGDMCITEYNGTLKAMTEYTQDTNHVGVWTLTPHTADSLFLAEERSTPADYMIGTNQVAIYSKGGSVYAKARGQSEVELTGGGSGGGSTTAVETFETGDLAEYSGATSFYSAQSSTVHGGAYALSGTSDSGSFSEIYDADHANAPSSGQTFEFWVRAGQQDANPSIGFGIQSDNNPDYLAVRNGYYVEIKTANSTLNLNENSAANTGISSLASASQSFTIGAWYRCVVDWGTGGSMTVTLYDDSGTQLNQISGSSTTFTTGGISFAINSPSGSLPAQFDDYKLVQ